MACEKDGQIVLNQPYDQVWLKLLEQPTIGGFPITAVRPEIHTIFLKTSLSMTSYGENITVSAYDMGNMQTAVTVTSKPSLPTVLIDWGRNQKNVDSLLWYIRNQFPA